MPKKCFYLPARLRMRYNSVGKQLRKNYLRRAQQEGGYAQIVVDAEKFGN